MIPAIVTLTLALGCTQPGLEPDGPGAQPCPAPVEAPVQVSPQASAPLVIPAPTPAPYAVPTYLPGEPAPPPTAASPAITQAGDPVPSADPANPDELVVVAKRRGSREGDPVAAVNEVAFAATQAIDGAVVRPVAMGYAKVVPKPVRNGLRNFLYNLTEPVVFLNYLLQLKPGKAMETVGRFAVNTTLGVAGLFDFARRKPFKLPRRANGFADTLGYYGVKPGAFLFLPIVGPTTVRDVLGNTIDGLLLPVAVGNPFNKREYTVTTGLAGSLDDRVENDQKLAAQRKGDKDAYSTNRDAYLAVRQAEIDHLRGRDRKPVTPPAVVPTVGAEPGRTVDPIDRSPVRTRIPLP